MKDYNYKSAFTLLYNGNVQLALCITRTILTHKALTALVISMLLNVGLFVSLAKERSERDFTSKRMYEVEHKNDSLRHTHFKYLPYSTRT